MVDYINEDSVNYKTTQSKSMYAQGIFGMVYGSRGDSFCLRGLKEILTLCIADEKICKMVYETDPPTYQMSRYSDWWREYIEL